MRVFNNRTVRLDLGHEDIFALRRDSRTEPGRKFQTWLTGPFDGPHRVTDKKVQDIDDLEKGSKILFPTISVEVAEHMAGTGVSATLVPATNGTNIQAL